MRRTAERAQLTSPLDLAITLAIWKSISAARRVCLTLVVDDPPCGQILYSLPPFRNSFAFFAREKRRGWFESRRSAAITSSQNVRGQEGTEEASAWRRNDSIRLTRGGE